MTNSTKQIVREAGIFGGIGIALSIAERLIIYSMDPEVLVEEKTYLKNNAELLKEGFAK